MINRIMATIALAACFSQASYAQTENLTIYCDSCRNLQEHPEDARNFAINQVYGSEQWLTFDEGDRFFIIDKDLNMVNVDLNIEYIYYDLPLPLPDWLNWVTLAPADMLVQIRLIYPNGDLITYKYSVKDFDAQDSLPVPANAYSEDTSTDTTTNDNDGDDFGEDEEENWTDSEIEEFFDDPWESDGSCTDCEAYFDADEDGIIDDDPYEWTEEL